MTPNPFLLPEELPKIPNKSMTPIEEFSSEELQQLGIARPNVSHPFYSIKRGERHASARLAMALLYSQGAAIINQGRVNETFTLMPLSYATTQPDALIEMTPKQAQIAYMHQFALKLLPESMQITSSDGFYEKNLLQAAIVAKIALTHMEQSSIAVLFEDLEASFGTLTQSPRNNFDLPNGSRVNECFALSLLAYHIAANPGDFTKDQVRKATERLAENKSTTLLGEILSFRGYSLKRLQAPYSNYLLNSSLISVGYESFLAFYNKERPAFYQPAPMTNVILPSIMHMDESSPTKISTESRVDYQPQPLAAASTKTHAAPDPLEVEGIKTGLAAYKKKIEETYAGRFDHAFAHFNFSFFKTWQAENREANYLLAVNLLQRLDSGEPIEEVFPSRKELLSLRKTLMCGKAFHDHGINSFDLNLVLDAAIKLIEAKKKASVMHEPTSTGSTYPSIKMYP